MLQTATTWLRGLGDVSEGDKNQIHIFCLGCLFMGLVLLIFAYRRGYPNYEFYDLVFWAGLFGWVFATVWLDTRPRSVLRLGVLASGAAVALMSAVGMTLDTF